MAHLATRNSSKALSAGDLTLTVASGAPVIVFGILLSNNAAGSDNVFTIKDAAGVTIQKLTVLRVTTIELSTQWLADKGLQITGVAGDSVTVLHNNPGR